MKVFDEPLGESNTERREKYQLVFQKKAPNNIFVKFKKFYPWGKNFGVQGHQDYPKSKIYTNHSNQNIFGGGNFFGGTNSEGGEIFRPAKMLVFAIVIVFLTFFRIWDKFSRWGKNSLGGVKIHQVGTSETVRYVRSSS